MKQTIQNYIEEWEKACYFEGIPDEVPLRIQQLKKAPSCKAVCIAILKNDHALKTLGFTPKKSKYYSSFKRIEISQRSKFQNGYQLSFGF